MSTATIDTVLAEVRELAKKMGSGQPSARLMSAREVEALYRLPRGQVEADWHTKDIPGVVRSSRGCKGRALFIAPEDARRVYGVRYHV